MPTVWRLLQDSPAPGAWNMAVDEALLTAVAAGDAPPTLRLYAWRPACLSLGYFQPIEDADADACARHGVDLVRRPTGGSAILHDDELTYSVIAPESNPLVSGDILTSYRKIAVALATGLRNLGVPVELAGNQEIGKSKIQNPKSKIRPAPCFIRPSDYEILVGGKKLAGSAQMRRQGVLLQHGAIPLSGDPAAIVDLLRLPGDVRQATRRSLLARATTIEEALRHKVAFDQAAQALVEGFCQAWGIELALGRLPSAEESLAQKLQGEKYGCLEWTYLHNMEKWKS